MATPIKTVRDELAEISRRMRDVVDLATQEGRDLTAEEQQEVTALDRRGRLLQAKLPQAESLPSLLQNIRTTDAPFVPAGRGDSLGDAYTKSGAYQAISANLPTSAPWRSVPVDVPFKLTATALLSPAGGWRPDVAAPAPVPPSPRVAALLRQVPASGGVVSYLRDNGQTKTAAVVAEGTAKPELSLVLPQVDAQVPTIAVWAAVSNQTLEDVASFKAWLDGVFAQDVYDKLDDEVLNGPGTGGRMLGLRATPGVGSIAHAAGENSADTIARAIASVYAASRLAPDYVVIDPSAYVALLTVKASTAGTYLSGAPMSASPSSLLWGVPVVASAAMPAGEALVGSFQRAAALYLRHSLRIVASTEHADFFTKNLTAILGELRAVVGVERPAGFCKVTALPVPTP